MAAKEFSGLGQVFSAMVGSLRQSFSDVFDVSGRIDRALDAPNFVTEGAGCSDALEAVQSLEGECKPAPV